jgi:hypothetical protein
MKPFSVPACTIISRWPLRGWHHVSLDSIVRPHRVCGVGAMDVCFVTTQTTPCLWRGSYVRMFYHYIIMQPSWKNL